MTLRHFGSKEIPRVFRVLWMGAPFSGWGGCFWLAGMLAALSNVDAALSEPLGTGGLL